jgi:hypothetical protein
MPQFSGRDHLYAYPGRTGTSVQFELEQVFNVILRKV